MRISQPRDGKDVPAHHALPKTRKSWSGQNLVEFAIVVPVFFLLLCALFDFGYAFYAQMTLQNAVRQAGRFAVTGNRLPDPKHPGKDLSRVDSIINTAKDSALGLDISGIQVSSVAGGKNSAGGPGDTVTVSITTDLHLVTPFIRELFGPQGVYRFTVNTSFRNEPFDPANSN
jgi:Flp pilus assembly protein TadG